MATKTCRNCSQLFEATHPRWVNCKSCVETFGSELQKMNRADWSRKHRDVMNASKRSWEAAHPEMVKAQKHRSYLNNAEEIKAVQRAYTKTEQGRLVRSISNYKRRGRILEGNVSYEFMVSLKSDTEVCVLCDQVMNDIVGNPLKKSIDHIVPLVIGGRHEEANLRCICTRCNILRPKDGSDLKELVYG